MRILSPLLALVFLIPAGCGARRPGALLGTGTFQMTYYWVTEQGEFSASANTNLYSPECTRLATVPTAFAKSLAMEGTGRLADGRVLNYAGACACDRSPCFVEVDAAHAWGIGAGNRALVPFRTVAVDPAVVAIGTKLYVKELAGVTMPGDAPWGGFVHDGCLEAADTGGAIDGQHLDFFSARKGDYRSLDGALGLTAVTVRAGGKRCP